MTDGERKIDLGETAAAADVELETVRQQDPMPAPPGIVFQRIYQDQQLERVLIDGPGIHYEVEAGKFYSGLRVLRPKQPHKETRYSVRMLAENGNEIEIDQYQYRSLAEQRCQSWPSSDCVIREVEVEVP
jgi:hypothetical protein